MPPYTLNRLRSIATKASNPLKVLNYIGIRAALIMKPDRVPFLPPRIEVEPINTCNLKCRHCQVPHWSKTPSVLGKGNFKSILDQFPNLLSVKLQGMGEPLLNRELLEMLQEAEQRGISTQIFSNGTIYNEEIARRLLQLKRLHICFSIDGATVDTFEKIRVGARFDRVVDNIRRLTEARGNNRTPIISATTVVTSGNIQDLSQIVKLAAELRMDYLSFQTFLSNWGKKSMSEFNSQIRVDSKSDKLSIALRQAREIAVNGRFRVESYFEDHYSRKKKCPWPWTRTFIAANGDVVPCCIIADSDVISMGNIFRKSFVEIWNSREYREFRRKIRKHDLHDFCRNCYQD